MYIFVQSARRLGNTITVTATPWGLRHECLTFPVHTALPTSGLGGKLSVVKGPEQSGRTACVVIPTSRRPPALGRGRLSQELAADPAGGCRAGPGSQNARRAPARSQCSESASGAGRGSGLCDHPAEGFLSARYGGSTVTPPCRRQRIWSGSRTCIIITTGTRLKSPALESVCKALFYTSLFTWGLINEYLAPLIHN